MRNASKFKQNALWCSIIWLLSFSLLYLLAELQNKQWCLLFFNSWVYDDIKVSFSPLGLVSWKSFRSASTLSSSTLVISDSVGFCRKAGMGIWSNGKELWTGVSLGWKKRVKGVSILSYVFSLSLQEMTYPVTQVCWRSLLWVCNWCKIFIVL